MASARRSTRSSSLASRHSHSASESRSLIDTDWRHRSVREARRRSARGEFPGRIRVLFHRGERGPDIDQMSPSLIRAGDPWLSSSATGSTSAQECDCPGPSTETGFESGKGDGRPDPRLTSTPHEPPSDRPETGRLPLCCRLATPRATGGDQLPPPRGALAPATRVRSSGARDLAIVSRTGRSFGSSRARFSRTVRAFT